MNKVPNGWISSTVGDACTIRNNLRLPINSDERESIKGDFPYFGPTGILSFINDYKIDDSFALIGEDGDHFLKFKEKEMTLFFSGKANVNNHAHIICDSSLCKARWFYFSFMHADITSHLTRQGAKRYKLTKASLEKLPILVPPLPEQIKIAEILSTWDNAINTVQKLLSNSQQQKKALMQQLLTGKKRFSGFEGEWEEKRLISICEKITDGAHNSPASVDAGGYPMYSVKDMDENNFKSGTARLISKDDYETLIGQNCRPQKNDVLIAKDGSILKNCFVVKDDINGVILSSIAILRPILSLVFPSYLAHYLKDDCVKQRILDLFKSGSGVPRIVLGDFKKIKIAIPALPEQQKIAAVLTTADQETDNLRAQLNHLKQEKKALMQQLLTGKRRVKIEEAA